MSNFFKIKAISNGARTGELNLNRGTIETPAFMPVGTLAAVKAAHPKTIEELGAEIVLANTYHLMLRPTAERIQKLGGLHQFMSWHKPILTDSGGFQIMSLASQVKISKDKAQFRSHIDGTLIDLSPERAMEVQSLLGSDIHMVLDECLKLPASKDEIKKSVELSLLWAQRSKVVADKTAKIFGIVQGGLSKDLRAYSAQETVKIDFDGYAIGGLSVGEQQSDMLQMLEVVMEYLPQQAPHYLMGVGRPDDIIKAVSLGVDMFDCVLPTREARHGKAYTPFGALNLRNSRFAEDKTLICPKSPYSRAYIHHLFNVNEPLGMMILTENNIGYYQQLMAECRAAIAANNFLSFAESVLAVYQQK